jgi:hypothetical protein
LLGYNLATVRSSSTCIIQLQIRTPTGWTRTLKLIFPSVKTGVHMCTKSQLTNSKIYLCYISFITVWFFLHINSFYSNLYKPNVNAFVDASPKQQNEIIKQIYWEFIDHQPSSLFVNERFYIPCKSYQFAMSYLYVWIFYLSLIQFRS